MSVLPARAGQIAARRAGLSIRGVRLYLSRRRAKSVRFPMLLRAAVLGFFAAALLSVPPARAEDFYKGKRLTILINFAAGGPTDIEGRLFARHLARHIEGQPAITIQNMDGAGGVVGAKFLGEVAPND